MLFVVCNLLAPTAVGLVNRIADTISRRVRKENHPAVHVTRGTADDLDQRLRAAQETLLVRVEYRHQRYFRQVKTFAQQIDSDNDVVRPQAQVLQDTDAFDRLHIRMQVLHFEILFGEMLRQRLGHSLGQSRYQRALSDFHELAQFGNKRIYLIARRENLNARIYQAGGADNLLNDLGRALQFVRARRRSCKDNLPDCPLPLVEPQRSVVQRRWKAEAVLHEGTLARTVSVIHPAKLGQRYVAFVHHHQEVVREILQQVARRLSRLPALQMARVVLDALAVAEVLNHLQIIFRALF